MTETAGQALPFESVGYAMESGFGRGAGDLRESQTSLKIDLATGAALLSMHQPTSDEGGEPLGTFRTVLPGEWVARLQTQLGRSNLGAVKPGRPDGPGRGVIRIRTARQGHAHIWNSAPAT
jgi:hypothetical protein